MRKALTAATCFRFPKPTVGGPLLKKNAGQETPQKHAKTYYNCNLCPRLYWEGAKSLFFGLHMQTNFKFIGTDHLQCRGSYPIPLTWWKEVNTYHMGIMKPYADSTHSVHIALDMPKEQLGEIIGWV